MLFTKPILIMAALMASTLASPTPEAEFIDKAYYKEHFAPGQLARLENYRATHTLTAEQDAFVGKLVHIVETADTSDLVQLKSEGEALFGDQAYGLLTGDDGQTKSQRSTAMARLRREAVCECTNGWGCDNGWHCPVSSTCHRHRGCGALYLYVCNGVCVT